MLTNQSCGLCGGSIVPWLHMPIDAKKNQRTPFSSVLKCRHCGLGTLSPLPEPHEIADLYKLDSYYTHGESHMPERQPSLADRVLTKLAWWADGSRSFEPADVAVQLPKGAKICDLGCGDAQYLRQFDSLGFDVTGVDPDLSARKQAAAAEIRVLEGTAEALPSELAGKRFDLVIMTHALEHCREPKLALQNAFSLTRPGALCYIEVPNSACEHFLTFTICSEMFDAPRHLYFFDPGNLQRMAEAAGFRIIDRLFAGYVRDFSSNWRAWEAEIADRVTKADPAIKAKRHSFAASLGLFLRSFWRHHERKYDSVGFLLQRPPNDRRGRALVRRTDQRASGSRFGPKAPK